jgi:hypothetical protein
MFSKKIPSITEEIYQKYSSLRDEYIKDIRSDNLGYPPIQIIQRASFFLFILACFAKKSFIYNNKSKNIDLDELEEKMSESKTSNDDLDSIFQIFSDRNRDFFSVNNEQFFVKIMDDLSFPFYFSYKKKLELGFSFDWKRLMQFTFQLTKKYDTKVIHSFKTIFERDLDLLTRIKKQMDEPTKGTVVALGRTLTKRKLDGVYYTPNEVASFISQEALIAYFSRQNFGKLPKTQDIQTIPCK